jgi:hypothetical protein
MTAAWAAYAMARWRWTDIERPVAGIRFRTATPMAASACWATKPRARIRGPMRALVSVCRCHALKSSGTMRFRRRARIEMKAIATNATRWSFERSKMVFNRR